jgi:hypothetical protein
MHLYQYGTQRVEKARDALCQRQVNAPCLCRDRQAGIGDDQGILVPKLATASDMSLLRMPVFFMISLP